MYGKINFNKYYQIIQQVNGKYITSCFGSQYANTSLLNQVKSIITNNCNNDFIITKKETQVGTGWSNTYTGDNATIYVYHEGTLLDVIPLLSISSVPSNSELNTLKSIYEQMTGEYEMPENPSDPFVFVPGDISITFIHLNGVMTL